MEEIPISNLMNKKVCQVGPKTYLKKIIATMHDNELSCLLVCKDEQPLGIITNSTLVNILAEGVQNGIKKQPRAEAIMSSPPMVFNKNMSAFEVLFLAQTQNIAHLPIVDDENKLCGMVSSDELLISNYRLLESHYELRKLIESNNAYPGNSDKDTNVPLEDKTLNIGNQQFMQMDLQYTHDMALRYDRPYSIILIEVDYFGTYMSNYGLDQAMQTLKRLVEVLKNSARGSDRIYRYKYATFIIILPETDQEGANLLSERLVAKMESLALPNLKDPRGIVTTNAGVASEEPSKFKDVSWEQNLERAEDALITAQEYSCNLFDISERDKHLGAASSF